MGLGRFMSASGHFRVRRWAVLIGRARALSCPPVGIFSCPPTNQIGSDAGDWISNIQTQPHVLKPGSLAAYSSISLAVVAVNVWSVGLLIADEHHHGQALLGVIVHAVFFLCFLSVLVSYAIGGSWLLGKVAKRTGAYTVAPADSGMGNDPRHAAGTGADGISKP